MIRYMTYRHFREEIMNYILLVLILLLIITILLLTKYCLRHRFPVSVICWFCGEKTEVPYDNRNCWDCTSCEQYNGFDEDGNYNKPIPAQHDARLNHPIRCQEDEFIVGDNVLCDRCTQNQLLKIKQLANFVPYNEKNYDQEVDAFKRHIEKVYNLCLVCERKVKQTVRFQDEAISKRLVDSHLNDCGSFMENIEGEQTFLHSSYTDKKLNRLIVASFVLHTVSLLCSLLVAAKEIRLDGDQLWQKKLLFIHPVLLWLDKKANILAVTGLSSGLIAKLILGKYRLHIIDAVSCPVWLLVLLSQTGFLTLHESGSIYHICCLVLNCMTSAVCLGINRQRRDMPNMSMIKMSLDNSISDSASSISQYSSVRQVAERSRSEDQRSEVESRAQVTSTTDPEETGMSFTVTESSQDFYTDKDSCQTNRDIEDESNCLRVRNIKTENKEDNIDNTTTVLNSFSLGEPSMKRNNSGVFSSVSFGSFASNLDDQSVSQNLWSRKLGQGRPLLSPATFTHASSTESHRSSPIPRHGLFSVPGTETPPSFTDRPGTPRRPSAFRPTNFFSSQRHSFTPERPASPVVTSFGESPFYNIPLQSDNLSQFSTYTTNKGSFSVDRNNSSAAKRFSSVARQFQPLTRNRLHMNEMSDTEEDSFSGITSISRRGTPNKSAVAETQVKEIVPWWQNPGLIGFFLGGSVVANIIFTAQIWLNSARWKE